MWIHGAVFIFERIRIQLVRLFARSTDCLAAEEFPHLHLISGLRRLLPGADSGIGRRPRFSPRLQCLPIAAIDRRDQEFARGRRGFDAFGGRRWRGNWLF